MCYLAKILWTYWLLILVCLVFYCALCKNFRSLPSQLFCPKNFVKSNYLLLNFTMRCFHEICSKWYFSRFSIMCEKLRIYSHHKYFVKSTLYLFTYLFSKTVTFTEFLPKMRKIEFTSIPHITVENKNFNLTKKYFVKLSL